MSIDQNYVFRLSNEVCLVYLEAFIDCDPDDKWNNLYKILEMTKSYKTILASLTREPRDPDSWLPWVQFFLTKRQATLIFDSVFDRYESVKQIPNAYFIDFFLLRTNFEISTLKTSPINRQWNHHTNRFLFLTGKPNGLHRAFLLQQLMRAGLKQNCVWSLSIDDASYDRVRKTLGLDEEEMHQFVQEFTSSPDKIKRVKSDHYGGFPYDCSLYENTSFRLISESEFVQQKRPWLTEKTWTTIANHHPFIMAGNVGTLEHLSSMGFKTFEKYLTIENYDTIQDPRQRIDAIVTNTKNWLQTMAKDCMLINSDVEFNVKIYHQLVQKNNSILLKICNDLNVDVQALYQTGYFSDISDRNWLLFYYNVKDDSWPYCLSERNFPDLPLSVREELVNTFGFHPQNL